MVSPGAWLKTNCSPRVLALIPKDFVSCISFAALQSGTKRIFLPAMFTGLIEEIGRILRMQTTDLGTQLKIAAPAIAKTMRDGESIAVNGCCLTVAGHRAEELTFDLLQETLDRTNLRLLRPDSSVNLERALAADGRIGGHFVQGHVDRAGRVVSFEESGADHRLEIELPADFAHYVVCKGSVAVNGISLTVA